MRRPLLILFTVALFGGALAAGHTSLKATYNRVDAQGRVILTYAGVPLPVQLYRVKLRPGAAGVLALLLPSRVQVRAEIVVGGKLPQVILWRGPKNLNEELLMQGVAEGIR